MFLDKYISFKRKKTIVSFTNAKKSRVSPAFHYNLISFAPVSYISANFTFKKNPVSLQRNLTHMSFGEIAPCLQSVKIQFYNIIAFTRKNPAYGFLQFVISYFKKWRSCAKNYHIGRSG